MIAQPRPRIIVVGASLGGLGAVRQVLSLLPLDFPLPIAIAQHRQSDGSDALRHVLGRSTRLPVSDAEDKEPIQPGHVYLAPADYHLLIERGRFALSTEARVNWARPSVDVLFDSAAYAYRQNLLAVVLTGASPDGAAGVARVKAAGGVVIVQDPATAESRAMPEAALAAAQVDRVLPLDEIARWLIHYCHAEAAEPAAAQSLE